MLRLQPETIRWLAISLGVTSLCMLPLIYAPRPAVEDEAKKTVNDTCLLVRNAVRARGEWSWDIHDTLVEPVRDPWGNPLNSASFLNRVVVWPNGPDGINSRGLGDDILIWARIFTKAGAASLKPHRPDRIENWADGSGHAARVQVASSTRLSHADV